MTIASTDWHQGSRTRGTGALLINIFGGPGSGKSTLAARLFAALKQAHVEAACPEEHAKLAIWSGQSWVLDHQIVLLGRTWETTQALLDKVDVVILDSPILLCSVYAGDREPAAFHDLVHDLHCRTDRANILLDRQIENGYSTNGRRESESEALAVDGRIDRLLRSRSEPVLRTNGQDGIEMRVLEMLRARAALRAA